MNLSAFGAWILEFFWSLVLGRLDLFHVCIFLLNTKES